MSASALRDLGVQVGDEILSEREDLVGKGALRRLEHAPRAVLPPSPGTLFF